MSHTIDESGREVAGIRTDAAPPDGWVELGGNDVMSNFDHEIDNAVEALLREGGAYSRHSGWEFNGLVWFSDDMWHEQVWRHHAPVATFSAPSLRLLMEAVNDEWGWD